MIYICIPAHNEEQTVGVVLWKIRQMMAEFPRDYQILVADDASTDATAAVLAPYARVLPLTIIRNPERHGYAASLEMLLREAVKRAPYAKRDVIVTLQADFTDDPHDLVALVKRIEAGADIVTGNTILSGDAPRRLRWGRAASLWAAQRAKWPDEAGDPLSSYRAYRVHTLRRTFDSRGATRLLRSDGWAANVELLRAALPHARRTESVDLSELRTARLQRPTRFRPWTMFRQVLSVARDRVRTNGDAAALEPVQEATTSREGIYIDADTRVATQPARRSGSGGATPRGERGRGRGQSADSGTRSRDGARQERGRSQGQSQNRSRAQRDGTRSDERVRAPITTPEETASPAEAVSDASGTAGGTERKRRRSRRGGRRRRAGSGEGQATTTNGQSSEPTDVGESAPSSPGDSTVRAEIASSRTDETDATAPSGGDATSGRKRRSRRGTRGGRRRKRPQGDAPAAETGDGASPDASAPGAPPAVEPEPPAPAYDPDAPDAQRQAS